MPCFAMPLTWSSFFTYPCPVLLEQITIAGVGLLGGSIGLGVKQRGLARRVVGYVRRESSAAACLAAGAVDAIELDAAAAVRGSDLVVLCTPISQMLALAKTLLPGLKPGALVTDVGSVKTPVVREIEPLIAGAAGHFIGSHPMAGAEQMGVGAARSSLFEGALVVVTPAAGILDSTTQLLEDFWQALGGRTLRLPPEFHDFLACQSSHLPHLVASALARYVLDPAQPPEVAKLCATGFRDTTRVAAGSPEMWRDILLANQAHILHALEGFTAELAGLRRAVEAGDGDAVLRFFEQARSLRMAWAPPKQEIPE